MSVQRKARVAERATKLAEELWALRESQLFCDVAVVAGAQNTFFAHQVVLASATPALRGLFAGQRPLAAAGSLLSAPPQAQELQLRGCSQPGAVKAVLDQAYLRQAPGRGSRKPSSVRAGGQGRKRARTAAAAAAAQPAADASKLADRLRAFRGEGFLCDLVITAAGTNIVAHQAVLAAASFPFREYALDGISEPGRGSSGILRTNSEVQGEASAPPLDVVQPLQLELGGISHAEAVYAMLDYVYATQASGQWPQTIGANKDVLALSEAFELQGLAHEARSWLHSHGALRDAAASSKHSPLSIGLGRPASLASINHPTSVAEKPFEAGCTVVTVSRVLMREGEDLSSQPVEELAAGTRCIVLASGQGVNGQRVYTRVIDTGREGWLSRVGRGGTTLLELALSDAAKEETAIAASTFEVGSIVSIVSRVLMREGEDLSSQPVVELAAGTRCVVLASGRGVNGQRVHARVIDTGREGWLSRVSRSGTTLLEPATSDAPCEEVAAGACAFEVGCFVTTISKALMREGEDLSSLPVGELLPPGTVCTILGHGQGTAVQRVRARVMETGQEGWLSMTSKNGTCALEVGSLVATANKAFMREGEDLSSPPVGEPLPPRTVCTILGHGQGTAVQRVRARVRETGQEGWLSMTSKNGTVLLAPGLCGAPRPAAAAGEEPAEQAEAAAPSTPPSRTTTRAEDGDWTSADSQRLTPPKAAKRRRDAAEADPGGIFKLPRREAGASDRNVCGIS